MNILTKTYWKLRNLYEVYYKQSNVQGLGCLPHRKDKRDFVFGWGGKPEPAKEYTYTGNDWIFCQNPLNICVFASNIMASSHQEGKRFSVKFAVKLAKKLGMITGNGFSYLRAGLEIATKYGRLPYEMMSDEVHESWPQYCKYDITDEMLNEAAKWKCPAYRKVTNAYDAIELLENGYCLVTGMKWYSAMNEPQNYNNILVPYGVIIGGHAIEIGGSRAPNLKFQDYINPQTFGVLYGDDGKVYIKNIFTYGFYDVYMMEKIADRTDEDRVKGRYEGHILRGTNAPIYRIENGLKRGFVNEEVYIREKSPKFISVSDETINLFPDGELII